MDFFTNMSPGGRRNALAVGMLAVLLAGTGAAWLITAGRSGARPGEQWYLIRAVDGTPAGWQVDQRRDDGRQGYQVVGSPQSVPTLSRWRLDVGGAKGRYVSAVPFTSGRRGGIVYRFTGIDYDADVVQLRRWDAGSAGTSKALTVSYRVDEFYIPEGTLSSVVAAAARSGEQVLRTMVRDEFLQVVPVVMSPGAAVTRRVAGRQRTLTPVTLTYELDPPEDNSVRYYVADDGSIPLREFLLGDTVAQVVELSTFEEVSGAFRSAAGERARALRRHAWQ